MAHDVWATALGATASAWDALPQTLAFYQDMTRVQWLAVSTLMRGVIAEHDRFAAAMQARDNDERFAMEAALAVAIAPVRATPSAEQSTTGSDCFVPEICGAWGGAVRETREVVAPHDAAAAGGYGDLLDAATARLEARAAPETTLCRMTISMTQFEQATTQDRRVLAFLPPRRMDITAPSTLAWFLQEPTAADIRRTRGLFRTTPWLTPGLALAISLNRHPDAVPWQTSASVISSIAGPTNPSPWWEKAPETRPLQEQPALWRRLAQDVEYTVDCQAVARNWHPRRSGTLSALLPWWPKDQPVTLRYLMLGVPLGADDAAFTRAYHVLRIHMYQSPFVIGRTVRPPLPAVRPSQPERVRRRMLPTSGDPKAIEHTLLGLYALAAYNAQTHLESPIDHAASTLAAKRQLLGVSVVERGVARPAAEPDVAIRCVDRTVIACEVLTSDYARAVVETKMRELDPRVLLVATSTSRAHFAAALDPTSRRIVYVF